MFSLDWRKKCNIFLLHHCVLSPQLSVQSIAPGMIRQLWTPPPHSFIHMTHGTPREWKVLYNLETVLQWMLCYLLSSKQNLYSCENGVHLLFFTVFMIWFFSLADVTYSFDQVIKMNSPESCWTYLINLEKRGNPHTDISLLNKLKDCYSKIFSRLPIRQYSKNAFYARILVRYAELKG